MVANSHKLLFRTLKVFLDMGTIDKNAWSSQLAKNGDTLLDA